MEADMGTSAAPASLGWTCGQCGQWVPNGTTHACWAQGTSPNPPKISFTIHPTPTWLSCPDCGSSRVRALVLDKVTCPNGHAYTVPKGPIAFYMEAT